jgi:STE24 endopeptidase
MDAGWLIAGGCLAALASLVLFRGGQVQAKSIERSGAPDKVHDLRVALRWMTRIAWPCGGAAAALAAGPVHWSAIGPGPAALVVLVALACLALPPAAARRPVMSAYARLRGIPVRALRSYRQRAAAAIPIVVFLGPIAVAVAVGGGVAVQAVVLAAGYLVAVPLLTGILAPVLARIVGSGPLPAEAEARLSGLAAALGVRVHGRLIRARERKLANAGQVGWLPGLRYVLVTDYLLDELTPTEIDALLAHELAHARRRDGITRQAIACVFFFPAGLLLTALLAHRSGALVWGLTAACFAIGAGFTRLYGPLAIRQELAADDLAAAVVGPASLAAALARVTELNEIKRETSLAWNRDVGHPAMSMRLARLRPDGVHAEVAPEK